MKVQTKISLESGDCCSVTKLEGAYNLIGGFELATADQKPFGRIRGNDFTMGDARRAVAIVHRRSAEMLTKADTAEVFKDPKLQAFWADAERSTARLAVRHADQFLDDLEDDLRENVW